MSQLITPELLGKKSAVLLVAYPNRVINHEGILTFHKGKPYVFHCDDIMKNRYGGSIVYETLDSFLSGRKIKKVTVIDVPFEQIQAYSFVNRYKEYNKVFYNCEQYTRELATGKKRSPQLRKWLTTGTAMLLLPVII